MRTDAPVTIRLLIRLLLNGLATFELRRVFCSNEGACVRLLSCARQMTPRPVQHGGGVELDPVLQSTERRQCFALRADCGGRLFTAKLAVVVHYLPHQLLDHLLADDAILLARQFCDCLRDRVNDFICFIGVDFV